MESFFDKSKEKIPYVKTPVKRKRIRRPGKCSVCGKLFNDVCAIYTHMRIHTGEKPFACSICGRDFNQSSNLKRHLRSHRGERPFFCEICNKNYAFQSKPYFQQHMQSHIGHKPFACELCEKSYSFKASLTNHIRSHAKKMSFICNICHAQFSSEGRLHKHLRFHDAVQKIYTCDLCKRLFTTRFSRNAHLINSHNILTAFECKLCHKRYHTQQGLRRHRKQHEEKENAQSTIKSKKRKNRNVRKQGILSDVCVNQNKYKPRKGENRSDFIPATLTSTSPIEKTVALEQLELLLDHGTVNHKFLCGVYQEEFCSMIEVNKHVKTHIKSENVSEMQNEDSFSVAEEGEPKNNIGITASIDMKDIPQQLNHIHGENPINCRFICDVCQHEFGSMTEISEHLKTHMGSENVSLIQNEDFSNVTDWNAKDIVGGVPMNTQIEVAPELLECLLGSGPINHIFLCGICGKEFGSVTELNEHLTTHANGETLFICGICKRTFSSSDELKNHINITHIL